tara:strand:+ start:235 stop:1704 length:1470 start_codon:yes stop_codon:yes gene_type:complete
MRLDQEVIQWAMRRKISPETLRAMNVGGEIISFGDANKISIIFNYLDNAGQIVNWKARSLHDKVFRQVSGGTQQFYNQAAVLQGPLDEVYIVEGEMDALALIEAGIPADSVLSVVGGAPANASENPQDAKRYGYMIDACSQGLSQCKRFIIVTDNDDPGRHLRADIATILGVASCHWVDWPPDIKDANDALIQWGAEGLSLYLREAVKEYPISGIFRLSEIPEPPQMTLWSGWLEWENRLKISPTCLSIMSGWPGHGKSHLSQQLWAQIVRRYDIRVALMSMETREKPFVRRNLRSAYWGKLEMEMSDAEKKEADDWIEDHFLFIHHPQNSPGFEWLCDAVNNAYARYGISAASIDPWNMIVPSYNSSKETETSWIGSCLDKCTYLAKACNLHLQILAHPAKPLGAGVREQITYSSIAGSQHWANKADQVMSIHRDKFTDDYGARNTAARLIVHKSRYEELGYPCEIGMKLSLKKGVFECIDYKQAWES